jgi:hypothetical protein
MKRAFGFVCMAIFVFEVCQSSSADGELSRLLVGWWQHDGGTVEYRGKVGVRVQWH